MLDRVVGKKGTQRRDAMEAELQSYLIGEAIKHFKRVNRSCFERGRLCVIRYQSWVDLVSVVGWLVRYIHSRGTKFTANDFKLEMKPW